MPVNKKVRFSIVIPCFNEETYIGNTLRSLLDQDYKDDFEIIVVDNNSTDNTAQEAAKYKVRVVKEETVGVCSARQKGAEEAKGEIIVSADADSTYSPDWLNKIDATFKSNPKIIGVTGPFRYDGGPVWAGYTQGLFNLIYFIYKLTGRVTYAPAANFAFKKSY